MAGQGIGWRWLVFPFCSGPVLACKLHVIDFMLRKVCLCPFLPAYCLFQKAESAGYAILDISEEYSNLNMVVYFRLHGVYFKDALSNSPFSSLGKFCYQEATKWKILNRDDHQLRETQCALHCVPTANTDF